MVRRNTRAVGATAEQEALAHLLSRGLDRIATNFHCRLGEIDLIMQDGRCLVFVEVRYRAGHRLAPAHLTVDRRKQRKLERTAAMFLARNRRFTASPVRFDVVAIDVDIGGHRSVNWIRDAFRPRDSSL